MVTAEQNKVIVRTFFEKLCRTPGDQSLANTLLASAFIHHYSGSEPLGREDLQYLMLKFAAAFPDGTFTIEDMIAEGNAVAARWSWRGTHLGEVGGIAPTGEHVRFTGMHFFASSMEKPLKIGLRKTRRGILDAFWAEPGNLQCCRKPTQTYLSYSSTSLSETTLSGASSPCYCPKCERPTPTTNQSNRRGKPVSRDGVIYNPMEIFHKPVARRGQSA